MSIKQSIEEYLENEPKFRERRHKDRGIVNLLSRRYGSFRRVLVERIIDKDTIVAIVQDYATMDRAWRQALERNPGLRGADYDEKDELEAQRQRELGYGPPTIS